MEKLLSSRFVLSMGKTAEKFGVVLLDPVRLKSYRTYSVP